METPESADYREKGLKENTKAVTSSMVLKKRCNEKNENYAQSVLNFTTFPGQSLQKRQRDVDKSCIETEPNLT